jgi:hypothetical protein
MPTITKVKHNGVWVEPSHIWVKHNGVWRDAQKVFVKHNGVWELVFPNGIPGSIVYNTAGPHNLTIPTGIYNLDYVIIGGGAGGAGGSDEDPWVTGGGGGGAGGLLTGTMAVTPGQIINCYVGGGGNGGGAMGGRGGAGGYSSVEGIIAPGGQQTLHLISSHYPYGGPAGNANSVGGTNGQMQNSSNGDIWKNGGDGGYVPGYSAAATGNGEKGKEPGGGGAGGQGVNPDGSTDGGKGAIGRIYLNWY